MAQDYFYVCAAHLKDRGFCSPVIDEEEVAEKKRREEFEREIEMVKLEYEEKMKKKKGKWKKKEDKEKKDDEDDAKDEDDEGKKAEKEKDDKVRTDTILIPPVKVNVLTGLVDQIHPSCGWKSYNCRCQSRG